MKKVLTKKSINKKTKIKATCDGSKADGFILKLYGEKDFRWDVALVESEMLEIHRAIGKKLKLC